MTPRKPTTKQITIEIHTVDETGKLVAFMKDEVAFDGTSEFFQIGPNTESRQMDYDTLVGVLEAEIGYALYGEPQ